LALRFRRLIGNECGLEAQAAALAALEGTTDAHA
jgi:hypothetical protein